MTPSLPLSEADPDAFRIAEDELAREAEGLELIASENHASRAVREAMATYLTNKYAEGYPGARYYGGCEVVDRAETLARDRCLKIFGGAHANVQPHSGAQANQAVYQALLTPGDPVLAMDLNHGGHLTHGHPKNFSGHFYKFTGYGVNPSTGRIDLDVVRAKAKELRPKMIVAGASAYPRAIDFAAFGAIAREVGALFFVDMAHPAGLVATSLHPDPVPHADAVTFTTHKTMRGPRGGAILCREDHRKKIDSAVFPGSQGGPLMHVILSKAVAFGEALQPTFRAYQAQVKSNAARLGERLLEKGFALVSGGTDNHLLLVDLRPKKTTGKEAEAALQRAGLTVNKNLIPGDPEKPMVTSGIRIGTPAVTTRGLREPEMDRLAEWIDAALAARADEAKLEKIRSDVRDFCRAFPLP
ncbi:MAG TPA: serine hydroxymethyltransferase [Planctomycetota bacterium]|nr:serine hydroxymethyltransferase [Planctomycetota bacterium]